MKQNKKRREKKKFNQKTYLMEFLQASRQQQKFPKRKTANNKSKKKFPNILMECIVSR